MPIGYFQYYHCPDFLPDGLMADDPIVQKDAVGFDMFIGEETYLCKGYGKQIIQHFLNSIEANTYLCDPKNDNHTMIKCLRKCRFEKYKMVGDTDVMLFKVALILM